MSRSGTGKGLCRFLWSSRKPLLDEGFLLPELRTRMGQALACHGRSDRDRLASSTVAEWKLPDLCCAILLSV